LNENIKQTKFLSLYQLNKNNRASEHSNNSKISKNTDFLFKNSIFNTNIDTLNDENLKRKRKDSNSIEDTNTNNSNVKPVIKKSPNLVKSNSKAIGSIKNLSTAESTNKMSNVHDESQDPNQFKILEREGEY